jgi:mannitol/fructose-specific phosphotransferase system IIA component (Ntr-type)
MSLEDSLQAILLLDDVPATTRDQAIEAILTRLAGDHLIAAELVGALRDSISLRDELGPTGIGEGVAIPHAWHPELDRVVVALAISRMGLDYPSLDGQRVHIVLLVLTPPSAEYEPEKQRVFDLWLRHLREPAFRASLTLAATPEALVAAIREMPLADS